jgi:uncharacterized membrane protein
MQAEEGQSLTPLSRSLVSALYATELLILGYFLYGAATGRLSLPSKAGATILSGWQAWIACLFPLSFLVLVVLRFDPAVTLSPRAKKRSVYICFAVALVALVVAVVATKRP